MRAIAKLGGNKIIREGSWYQRSDEEKSSFSGVHRARETFAKKLRHVVYVNV